MPSRGVVLERDGHAALAGDQADVADGVLRAEVARVVAQVGADAAAGPVAQHARLGPVVPGVEGAGAVGDGLKEAGLGGVAAQLRGDDGADRGGDVEARVKGAVSDVADQRLLLLVAGPGQGDHRARVGGDDHADVARHAKAQGEVVPGPDVLDLAGDRRQASRASG